MAQLASSDIEMLLSILQNHQKDTSNNKGGGNPMDSSSAQLSQPNTSSNFVNWLNGIVESAKNTTGNIEKGASQDLVNAANTIGKYIGNQPIYQTGIPNTPLSIKGPTVAQTDQAINQSIPEAGNEANPLLTGSTKTPEDTFYAALGLVAPFYGGEEGMKTGDSENIEEAPPIAEASSIKSPVRVTLKPSVYGAGHEAEVQKTVDTEVPGNTAIEKYNNLEPTMSKLGDQIQTELDNNPKQVKLSQIKNDYMDNLKDQLRTGNLTSASAQKEIDGYLNDLTSHSNQQNIPKGQVEQTVTQPASISTSDLFKLKQKVNQDYQGVATKIERGTPLTDREKVISAGRKTLDDTIASEHPKIKQATIKQSHLYDAADSIFKARETEIKNAPVTEGNWADKLRQNNPTLYNALVARPAAMKAIDSNPEALNNPSELADILSGKGGNSFTNGLKTMGNIAIYPFRHLVDTAGLLTLGALGYGGLQLWQEAHSQQQNYNFGGVTTTYPGLSQIQTSTGNTLQQDYNQYASQSASLDHEIQNLPLTSLNKQVQAQAQGKLIQLQHQQDILDKNYSQVKSLYGQYTKTAQAVDGLKQAQTLVKKADPRWFSSLNSLGNILPIMQNRSPGYTQWVQEINNIPGINHSAILNAASPEAADAAIKQAADQAVQQLNTSIKTNGGNIAEKQISGKELLNNILNQTNNNQNSDLNSNIPTPTTAPSQAPQPIPTVPVQFGQL